MLPMRFLVLAKQFPIRPPSSVFIAILNPQPSSPSLFSLGTITSLNITEWVSELRIPILFSCGPMVIPFEFRSTMKALIPLCPLAASVCAITIYVFAEPPFVIQFFGAIHQIMVTHVNCLCVLRSSIRTSFGFR